MRTGDKEKNESVPFKERDYTSMKRDEKKEAFSVHIVP